MSAASLRPRTPAAPLARRSRDPGSRSPAAPGTSRLSRALRALSVPVPHPLTSTLPLLLSLLCPAQARAASLSIEGGPVVLGRTTSAEITLRVDEPLDGEALPLRLWVSAGSFGEPSRVAPGVYRVAYEPPPTRFPRLALVAAWKDGEAGAPLALLRFPLLGTTRLSVKAPPGRTVTVRLAGETFGPVAADERGEAVVPLVAPPGTRRATVTVKGRAALTRQVDLDIPPARAFGAIAIAGAEGGDRPAAARVLVVYEGAPPIADRVRLTASEGEVALEGESPGILAYRYVPPSSPAAEEVRFEARLADDPRATATARLALGRGSASSGATADQPSSSRAPAPGGDETRPGVRRADRGQAATANANHDRTPGAARLLAGVRAGFAHDLAEPAGSRFGVDLWAPVRMGSVSLGLGLSATAGGATRTLRNGGAATSRAAVLLAPLSARLGLEIWSSERASFLLGAGYTSAWALVTSASEPVEVGWASGALAFLAAGWTFGAGQAFAEVSLGSAPLALREGSIEASGVALDVGYRVAVF